MKCTEFLALLRIAVLFLLWAAPSLADPPAKRFSRSYILAATLWLVSYLLGCCSILPKQGTQFPNAGGWGLQLGSCSATMLGRWRLIRGQTLLENNSRYLFPQDISIEVLAYISGILHLTVMNSNVYIDHLKGLSHQIRKA
jgi:hypothetical protein